MRQKKTAGCPKSPPKNPPKKKRGLPKKSAKKDFSGKTILNQEKHRSKNLQKITQISNLGGQILEWILERIPIRTLGLRPESWAYSGTRAKISDKVLVVESEGLNLEPLSEQTLGST